jgi:hypothetical protein
VISHLPLPRAHVGAVLGVGGANAALIRARSGARVTLHRPRTGRARADDDALGGDVQTLALSGTARQVAAAEAIIAALLRHEGALPAEVEAALPLLTGAGAAGAAAAGALLAPQPPLRAKLGPKRDALMRKLSRQLGGASLAAEAEAADGDDDKDAADEEEPSGAADAAQQAPALSEADAAQQPPPQQQQQQQQRGGRGRGRGARNNGTSDEPRKPAPRRAVFMSGGKSVYLNGSVGVAYSADAPQGERVFARALGNV